MKMKSPDMNPGDQVIRDRRRKDIAGDEVIGISKQHTNSKQKLKNSKTIWKMKNNTELRRTQKENDKEMLIFEEP